MRLGLRRERDTMKRRMQKTTWATSLLCAALAGCTVGPKYHPPATQTAPAFKEAPPAADAATPQTPTTPANDNQADAANWTVAQPADAKIRGDWWSIFNDPELNELESQLNINNQTIKVSFENYMQSRSLVRVARAQYFPTINATPAYTRQKTSGNLSNTTSANTGRTSQIYSLPLEVSWTPDLFGRIRNQVREAQYTAQVSAADLENERLIEQADLATYFFEVRGQDALIKLYRQTVASYQQSVELTQAQYQTGIGDQLAVLESQTTLESAQASLTNLSILRAQYEHAIATLIGRQASGFTLPVREITTAPPPIPIGMPSLLLQRRPDVAAAERNMASANAALGVAYTAFYPAVTLSVGGGLQSSFIRNLADWPSRVWSVGPSIAQPIFNAALSAELHQYTAIYNANLATYRQTVLTAFQQVEDYLAQTRILSTQIQQQRRVVASAQASLDLEMVRYQTGIDPYLNVVQLQNTLFSSQSALASLQIEQMTGAIALVEALGGGWDRSQLPTPSQVTASPSKADSRLQQ